MAIERIAGVPQIPRPAPARSAAGRTAEATAPAPAATAADPAAQGTLEGELLARPADGLQFRLSALALAGHALKPGQVLLVQVMATSPQLQLALLGAGVDSPGTPGMPGAAAMAPDGDALGPHALQPDQAEMHRFSRPVLDTAAMAAGWHSMVLRRLQQARAVVEPVAAAPPAGPGEASRNAGLPLVAAGGTGGNGSNGGSKGAGEQPLVPMETAGRPAPTLLVFQALAWPGVALHFWLWRRRPGDAASLRRRTPGNSLRLRLAMALPQLGPVVVDIAVADKDVSLTFMTSHADATSALRERVDLIARRLASAGLRLAHCHAVHRSSERSAPDAGATADAAAHLLLSDTSLQPQLFRAASETVAALKTCSA